MRYAKGQLLPVPPVVAQRGYDLPGGAEDTAALTDCGEACCTSVLEVFTGYRIPVGAIREAMGKSADDGVTLSGELSAFLSGMGLLAYVEDVGSDELERLRRLRHFGVYRIILGRWIFPATGHWVVAYESAGDIVNVMDPWIADHRPYSTAFIRGSSLHAHVVVSAS